MDGQGSRATVGLLLALQAALAVAADVGHLAAVLVGAPALRLAMAVVPACELLLLVALAVAAAPDHLAVA